MDKTKIQYIVDSTRALAHLLIGGLALLSNNGVQLFPMYKYGTVDEKFINMNPSALLRLMENFLINEFDKSSTYKFPLETAAKLMDTNNPEREKLIQFMFNTCLTIPITRIFELTKSYCNETGQMPKFRKQSWYHVASILRNCFSHDFLIEIKIHDPIKRKNYIKKILPAKWDGILITEETLGKPLSRKNASIGATIKLFDTICHFALTLE